MRTKCRRIASLAAGLLAVGALALGCANEPSSAKPADDVENDALAYSKCMRDHGIEKFPDPDENGGIAIEGGPGLDPESQEFKDADAACKSLLPEGPSEEEQAEEAADALKYSKCMRSHGVPNFPDPNAEGGINIQPGMGFDPESPKFKAADKTCQDLMGGGRGSTSQHRAGS